LITKFLQHLSIASFAFLFGCNSAHPLNNGKPEPLIQNLTDSFPIEVGNYWHFSSSGSVTEIEWKIISDSIINGNLYFLDQISINKNICDTLFIRKDVNGDIVQRIGNEDFI
jgi:hypothetical protein